MPAPVSPDSDHAVALSADDAAVGDLVEAGAYSNATRAAEHGLVVLATGNAYWLEPSPTELEPQRHRLLVERAALPVVQRHLASYARECTRWPPSPISDPWAARSPEFFTPLLWALAVLAIHALTGTSARVADLWALDATAVFSRGEVWRAFTALFLHGDAAHVVSNALGGLLAFSALTSTLGRARGWLLVALAATFGNLFVAAINFPHEYRSLGASTAIFAAIGLLTGRAIRVVTRSKHPQRWRALFVPAASGFIVLGLHGAANTPRVDVGAHLCGFAAGLICGFIAALRAPATAAATPTPSGAAAP